MASQSQIKTRSGRVVKAPTNEYTERKYTAGSGFVGADHYDRSYTGYSSEFVNNFSGSGEYCLNDGFVVNDEDCEANSLSESEAEEEEVSESEDEDEEESESDDEEEEEDSETEDEEEEEDSETEDEEE